MIALLQRQLQRHLLEPVMLAHALLGFGPGFEEEVLSTHRVLVSGLLPSLQVWL
jgi:hypothetical protein